MCELRKNDIIPLEITDMNNLGYGIGRYSGVVVFVRGAVTGDVIECRIIKVNKSYCVGRCEKIITRSPHRANRDFCRAPAGCGGCVYRNITYEYELELKRDFVASCFRRAGLPEVRVEEVRPAGSITGYRNKAQYPVGATPDGRLFAGFYATGTHRIAGRADCPLQPAVFADIADRICSFGTKHRITAYDETTGKGILRHIYLRLAEATGEIMVCLVINQDFFPGAEELAAGLLAEFPGIVGVLLNINKERTNVVLGEKFVTVAGRDYIEDILCGLRFRIAPDSFYQVNHAGAELLYTIAREKVTGAKGYNRGTLLDLYCGAGTIGLVMADDFDEVIGIEIVPSAVGCARLNAKLNGIENASFYCGDAADAGGLLGAAERELGRKIEGDMTAILDPPRKGVAPRLIEYLAGRGIGRVVYVSCAPDTLARDCALFARLGYQIGEVTPVDMFPRTGHVETVVLMSKVKE